MESSGAGPKLAYHANCWGPLGGDAVGVTSIAQLTYRTFGDMERRHRGDRRARLCGRRTVRRQSPRLRWPPRRFALGACPARASGSSPPIPAPISSSPTSSMRSLRASPASPRPPRISAPSISSSAAAPSALTARGPTTTSALPQASDKVVAIADARGLRAHYHPHLTTIVEGARRGRRDFRDDLDRLLPRHRASRRRRRRRSRNDPQAPNAHLLRTSERLAQEPFAFTPLDEGDLDMQRDHARARGHRLRGLDRRRA